MKLHDANGEKELLRISRASSKLAKPDVRFWTGLHVNILLFLLPQFVAFLFLYALEDDPNLPGRRQLVCAIFMMALVRLGMMFMASVSQKSCLFTTFINLPVRGATAFQFVRDRFFRKFSFFALSSCFVISMGLHDSFLHPLDTRTLIDTALLLSSFFATMIICDFRLLARIPFMKVWFAAGAVAGLFVLYGNEIKDPAIQSSVADFLDGLIWIFPPAWIFPGKIETVGWLLAAVWIPLGLWSWLRWPAKAWPGYDSTGDFIWSHADTESEAFHGNEIVSVEPSTAIEIEPPLRLADKGWVDRLIKAALHKDDMEIAGAIVTPSKNYTKRVNLALIFAPVWLLAVWIGSGFYTSNDHDGFVVLFLFGIPAVYFFCYMFPRSDGILKAPEPYPIGNDMVPFFTLLPISIRSLLRISQRITIARGLLFLLIASPFFWALANICHDFSGWEDPHSPEILTTTIIVTTTAWMLARPLFIYNRVQTSIKRKRGIFIWHCAISSLIVILGILWFLASLAAIIASASWWNDKDNLFLIPIAIAALVASAVFARLTLEVALNEIRHRRYDWSIKDTSIKILK